MLGGKMEKRTNIYEARQQFDEILREVADRKNSYILERSGEAVAVVVPMRIYEDWQRQQGLDLLRQAQRNANMAETEAEQLVAEEILAMRAIRPTAIAGVER